MEYIYEIGLRFEKSSCFMPISVHMLYPIDQGIPFTFALRTQSKLDSYAFNFALV